MSSSVIYPPPLPEITVRRSTDAERAEKFPPLVRGRRHIRVPKYVVVGPGNHICSVFGLPQGGDTRSEAVFWAERFASKNDYSFVRPSGWEGVTAALDEELS